MMWKLKGRAALLTCALLATGLGLSSCGSSTLGYIYVTTVQYGQVLSYRLHENTGSIGGASCSVSNGGQQRCNNSTGGANPTKMVLANGNDFLYVLNLGSTSPASGGNIALFTLGGSGSVFSTGQTYVSSGQNPVDMYLGGSGGFIYVLDQYQPASYNNNCITPTPTTCPGDITVFAIGSNGNLTVVPNAQATYPSGPNQGQQLTFFPLQSYNGSPYYVPNAPLANYGGNHFYTAGSNLYVLDNSTSNKPQVDSYTVNATNGQLTNNQNTATLNQYFTTPIAITGTGSSVLIADAGNGAIWTYTAGSSNGALSSYGNGFFCPANPNFTYTTGGFPTADTCGTPGSGTAPSVIDSLLITTGTSNTYLYAADASSNNQIFAMILQPGTGQALLALSQGGPNPVQLGNEVSCMTVSSNTPYLYVSGNGGVAGEQIDTSTGLLTTRYNPKTSTAIQGYVPCIVYSPRT